MNRVVRLVLSATALLSGACATSIATAAPGRNFCPAFGANEAIRDYVEADFLELARSSAPHAKGLLRVAQRVYMNQRAGPGTLGFADLYRFAAHTWIMSAGGADLEPLAFRDDDAAAALIADLNTKLQEYRREGGGHFASLAQSLLAASPRRASNDEISLALLAGIYRAATGHRMIIDVRLPALALSMSPAEFAAYLDSGVAPSDLSLPPRFSQRP